MARFHLPPGSWDAAVLTGDEAKHAAQVLRLRRGDRITVFDGAGRSANAGILDLSKSEIRLELGEPVLHPAPQPRIHLAQAVPKGKTMDLIVQKAVELGVTTIQPLVTSRTVVQVESADASRKSSKWHRVALEACKQCGQNTLPEVPPTCSFSHWLRDEATPGLKIIGSLFPGARPLRDLLREAEDVSDLTLLIGPEGDFTQEEAAAAVAAGFQPATFGDIILRAETAALFALSAARYEFS